MATNLATRSTARPEAAERWARYSQSVRAADIAEARQKSMTATDFVPAADLFRELHDTLPDDAICVDEMVAQMPQMIQFLTSIDGTRDDRPMPRWSKRITRVIRSAHRSTSAGR